MFEALQTHTRMGRSVFPFQNEYNGTVFLDLLVTWLTGFHAFRLMYFQRALSLASSNELFSFSANREHTVVFVDKFANKISPLGTSLLQ